MLPKFDQTRPWNEVRSAPRDGTVVEVTSIGDSGPEEIWPMRWNADAVNGLFPGVVGFWEVPDGSITWNEADPEFGPTHWRGLQATRTLH